MQLLPIQQFISLGKSAQETLKAKVESVQDTLKTTAESVIKRLLPKNEETASSLEEKVITYFPPEEGFQRKGKTFDNKTVYTHPDMPQYVFLETGELSERLSTSRRDARYISKIFPFEDIVSDLKKSGQSESAVSTVSHQACVVFEEYRKRQWEFLGISVDRAVSLDPRGRWEVCSSADRKKLSESGDISGFTEDVQKYFFLEKLLGIELLGTQQKSCQIYTCNGHAFVKPNMKNQEFLNEDISSRHHTIAALHLLDEKLKLEELHKQADFISSARKEFLNKASAIFNIDPETPYLSLAFRAVDLLSEQNPHYLAQLKIAECLSFEVLATALWCFASANIARNVSKEEVFGQVFAVVNRPDSIRKEDNASFKPAEFYEQQMWDKSRALRLLYRLFAQELLSSNLDLSALMKELEDFLDEQQPNDSSLKECNNSYSQLFWTVISEEWDQFNNAIQESSNNLTDQVFALRWIYDEKMHGKDVDDRMFHRLNQLFHQVLQG